MVTRASAILTDESQGAGAAGGGVGRGLGRDHCAGRHWARGGLAGDARQKEPWKGTLLPDLGTSWPTAQGIRSLKEATL